LRPNFCFLNWLALVSLSPEVGRGFWIQFTWILNLCTIQRWPGLACPYPRDPSSFLIICVWRLFVFVRCLRPIVDVCCDCDCHCIIHPSQLTIESTIGERHKTKSEKVIVEIAAGWLNHRLNWLAIWLWIHQWAWNEWDLFLLYLYELFREFRLEKKRTPVQIWKTKTANISIHICAKIMTNFICFFLLFTYFSLCYNLNTADFWKIKQIFVAAK